MTVPIGADTPHPRSWVARGKELHAEPGDILIIDGAGMAGLPLIGIITGVPSQDGTPPYLVHWTAGDYDSRVTPGSGARIERHRSPEPGPWGGEP